MSFKTKKIVKKCSIARIQSSSSINTYRQCPRKYYLQYIKELKSKPSIHLIRGKIVHSIIEDFFKFNIENIPKENYQFYFKIILHDLISKHWNNAKDEFNQLDLNKYEIEFYLNETKDMLQFWLLDLISKIEKKRNEINTNCNISNNINEDGNFDLISIFNELKPISEEHFLSEEMGIQGFIDAIYKIKDKVKIIDYKTSKKDAITEDYKLQLSLYSLLYHEKYLIYPNEVGLFLLKHGERTLNVDEPLLEFGRIEIEKIHTKTSTKLMSDYPKKQSILCNWGKGRCDFFDMCFNNSNN
jgi:ATP-dependent exoDNAse (exonuclease V) beta subunit